VGPSKNKRKKKKTRCGKNHRVSPPKETKKPPPNKPTKTPPRMQTFEAPWGTNTDTIRYFSNKTVWKETAPERGNFNPEVEKQSNPVPEPSSPTAGPPPAAWAPPKAARVIVKENRGLNLPRAILEKETFSSPRETWGGGRGWGVCLHGTNKQTKLFAVFFLTKSAKHLSTEDRGKPQTRITPTTQIFAKKAPAPSPPPKMFAQTLTVFFFFWPKPTV